MKVLFAIWAKVGTIRGRGRGREEESTKEEHRRAQKSTEEHRTGRFVPEEIR